MAATEHGESSTDPENQELFTIEASVVTGFEECARGEAKEKFGTDVKAARGKITWKVPLDRVKDVVKMGSIDNCRVVVHSVPHFHFTDQHDSLARLQKMITDVDWESGLKVWKCFYDFPHPIVSKPDVIPSPEELVDVVVVTRQPQAKSKEEKKKKRGVRGKKKEKKKGKGKEGKGDETKEDEEVDSEKANKKEAGEKESSHAEVDEKEKTGVNSENSTSEGSATVEVSSVNVPSLQEPKTVVIKRVEAGKEPKVDIKVLLPGPNESVFPSEVKDADQRDVEPMDVDMSLLNASLDQSQTAGNKSPGLNDSPKEQVSHSPSGSTKSEESQKLESTSSEVKSSSIAQKVLDTENVEAKERKSMDEKEFVSNVIEKLTSPPESPVKHPSDQLSPGNLVTPPPTPDRSMTTPFNQTPNKQEAVINSSVDPLSVSAEKKGNDQSGVSSVPGETSAMSSSSGEITDLESKVSSLDVAKEASSSENSENLEAKEEAVAGSSPVKKERDPTKPTFRVTCNRVGDSHSFDSTSAAASFGSAVITYFNWSVNLKEHDIEVLLNIDNEEVTVGLALTKTSLHNRNLVAFGPTTLRATICYNMLRLCRIKNGDFICDPMCGTSAIPIEGALNWTNCYHFGGDFHEKAIERSALNIAAAQERMVKEKKSTLKIDAVQWDIQHFPLRDKCVDVFISDLPFGHRMGSRSVNRTLYPSLLTEMARTGITGARACLLTEDKTSLIKAIQSLGKFWQRRLILSVNIGGLNGFVFLLTRTAAAITPTWAYWKSGQQLPGQFQGTAGEPEAKPEDSEIEHLSHNKCDKAGGSSLGDEVKKDVSGDGAESMVEALPLVKPEITDVGLAIKKH